MTSIERKKAQPGVTKTTGSGLNRSAEFERSYFCFIRAFIEREKSNECTRIHPFKTDTMGTQ